MSVLGSVLRIWWQEKPARVKQLVGCMAVDGGGGVNEEPVEPCYGCSATRKEIFAKILYFQLRGVGVLELSSFCSGSRQGTGAAEKCAWFWCYYVAVREFCSSSFVFVVEVVLLHVLSLCMVNMPECVRRVVVAC